MRQNCIDTIETTTAPLPSWGQWAQAGVKMVKQDTLQLLMLLWTWHERSRQRHHLSRLSNHSLKDIGLTRADIDSEAHKPFWRG